MSPNSRDSRSTRTCSSGTSSTPRAVKPARTVFMAASSRPRKRWFKRSASKAPSKPLIRPPRLGSNPKTRANTNPGNTECAIRLARRMRRCVISSEPAVGQRLPINTASRSGIPHQRSSSATTPPHHSVHIADRFAHLRWGAMDNQSSIDG